MHKAFFLCATLTASAPLTAHAATTEPVDGNRITVIDGDTVALPCASPWPGCAEKVRLAGIDAPETYRPDCEEGLKIGLQAKARLAELIRGHQIYIERSGKDRYGRTLAALRIDNPNGLNAGMKLVREDLAVPYKPGHAAWLERKLYFCGPDFMPDNQQGSSRNLDQ